MVHCVYVILMVITYWCRRKIKFDLLVLITESTRGRYYYYEYLLL